MLLDIDDEHKLWWPLFICCGQLQRIFEEYLLMCGVIYSEKKATKDDNQSAFLLHLSSFFFYILKQPVF